MGKLGYYYDMGRCIGCQACQMACKDANNLEPGLFFRRVATVTQEENGEVFSRHYSGACNHCENPLCVKACPTGAMYVEADGTVRHQPGLCIGCGNCVASCPYGAPVLSRAGIVRKCEACATKREAGNNPACVDACVTGCLRFGDLEKLEEQYGPAVSSLSFLPAAELTTPGLRIKKDRRHE